MTLAEDQIIAAEAEWLERWSAGPTEAQGSSLRTDAPAPDLRLLDHTGRERTLSEFWADGPALVMFWRHFGCGCGFERASRLNTELNDYLAAGLRPVIVGQGEPARAAAYRDEHHLDCTILCDPDHDAYRAYGIGHWSIERVLPDAPAAFWIIRAMPAPTSRPSGASRVNRSSTIRGARSASSSSDPTGASASPTRTSTARTTPIPSYSSPRPTSAV